jgi:hypothetical protein
MNKRFLPALLLAVLSSILFFSCKKENDNTFSGEYNRAYFPLEMGRYVTYDVDSTLWDDFVQVKSVHKYQMRYTVADTFRDNAGRLSYRIETLIRKGDTLPWNEHRVLYVTPTDSNLELVENNLRYIKLVFPIGNDIQWKGNSMIPLLDADYQYFQDWNYIYSDYEKPFNHGKADFPNTVTVNQVDEVLNDPETMPNSYAYRTYGKEVYAFDVGMVYREMTRWEYQPNTVMFRRGYQVIMRAVDHN